MKKIIFYGVGNRVLRNKAEHYMYDNCVVVGYTDSFHKEDILQGKRFIPLDELEKEDYDYIIILSAKRQSQQEIRENLRRLGIPESKIVGSYLLTNENIYYCPDLLAELVSYKEKRVLESSSKNMDVILGLSYSLRGVEENRLKGDFYNLSWHGMDLYYNLRLLKEAGKIDTALLCFPYYYWDWDMSKSTFTVQGEHLWALRGFHDWHNALQGEREIVEHIINYELFGEKLFAEVEGKKFCRRYHEVIDCKDNSCELGKVWIRQYEETYEENIMLIRKMLEHLTKMNSRIIFIVPPSLYQARIKKEKLSCLQETKARFYDVINKMKEVYSFDFVDTFDMFQEKGYWADGSHLNETGKQAFTDYINTLL